MFRNPLKCLFDNIMRFKMHTKYRGCEVSYRKSFVQMQLFSDRQSLLHLSQYKGDPGFRNVYGVFG